MPGIDPVWETTILRCLARYREERFATARDVVECLHGAAMAPPQRKRDAATRTVELSGKSRLSKTRFAILLAAVLFICFAGALGGYRYRQSRRAASAVPSKPAIAVLGLKNISERPEDGWIGTALSEMLTTGLTASSQVRTVAGEDVARMSCQHRPRRLVLPPEFPPPPHAVMEKPVERLRRTTVTAFS